MSDVILKGNVNPKRITKRNLRARVNRITQLTLSEKGFIKKNGLYGILQTSTSVPNRFSFCKLSS